MVDSHVEQARREQHPQTPTTPTTAPGFKLFGKRILAEAEQPSTNKNENENENENSPEKIQPHHTSASGLPCPRCKSRETKFCYFNNYNVNQPRHFCRGCHRYWTAGGALRNVPVGAGRRKTTVSLAPARSGTETGNPNGVMMDGVVVQQWLMSRDGFPAKRTHVTSFHDRIR